MSSDPSTARLEVNTPESSTERRDLASDRLRSGPRSVASKYLMRMVSEPIGDLI